MNDVDKETLTIVEGRHLAPDPNTLAFKPAQVTDILTFKPLPHLQKACILCPQNVYKGINAATSNRYINVSRANNLER